jgi:hypothetical protein
MVTFFLKLAPTVIAIEACGASHQTCGDPGDKLSRIGPRPDAFRSVVAHPTVFSAACSRVITSGKVPIPVSAAIVINDHTPIVG